MNEELVGAVAHELRTPLSSILGYVEELRSGDPGPLTDEQQRFLEIVARNAVRLQSLIDDFVFLGRPSLQLEPVDLRRVAGADGNGAIIVEGDAGRLEQLVRSLVAATEADHVRVHAQEGQAILEVNGTTAPKATATARFELALVEAIVAAHRGELEQDGAAFEVRLPLTEPPA